jgi:hypothetical protein
MLQSNATKSGTGLAIYGDYEDLMGLYDVIHYLASALDEDNVAQKGRHQLLMNFAYEIRKAYSGDRLTDQERFNTENPEIPYYGFQLVWTDILVFLAVMRHTAGYIETDKLQQAVMCLLEQVVEKALLEYDVEGAHSIKQLIGQRINVSERTGKRRFRSIPDFIGGHFSEWRPEYKELIKSFEISANEQECKITDLEFSEFPEIKW